MEAGSERRAGSRSAVKREFVKVGRSESSIRRSKSECRRRCYTLGATALLTLTKRGKFASEDELWSAFARFSRLMKRLYREKWQYVAVPELHSDGFTFHMHCAIKGFFWAGIVRKIWYRALGGRGDESGSDTPGNIDITAFRRGRVVSAIARYVAKYLSKGLALRAGSRRLFASSGGLAPCVVARWRETLSLGLPSPYRIIERVFHGRKDLEVSWWVCGVCHGFTIKTPF